MSSPTELTIQENTCFQIDNFRVEVKSHLGQFTDVYYFQVNIQTQGDEVAGLLRVGDLDGGLMRELQLRQALGDYKMVSELLATEQLIVSIPPVRELKENPNFPIVEQEPEYLEETFYQEIGSETPTEKIILLSYLPEEGKNLSDWLCQETTLEQSLLLASQVCQFFRYVYQHGWCFFQIIPKFIQFQIGVPVQFFDLTSVHHVGEKLPFALEGDYCAPEIAYIYPIEERMSTYVVGAILYHSIHKKLPVQDDSMQLDIKPIPQIYQILSVCLCPAIEERFLLSQLLSLLIETRQSLQTVKVEWDVAVDSIVGLSLDRLHNEDNYGIRQQYLSEGAHSLILGVIADGMGGMAQGEVASLLAVQTVLEAAIPRDFPNPESCGAWLLSLVQTANDCVAQNVNQGGTTLSIVLVSDRQLIIAHVGDSRIFLLRNGQICQLSEDHSLVSMLLANGQITYEESKNHPDRNILTKSIGTRRTLSHDYIQTLSHFGSGLSISLENDDILLLCSDGVWDLVPADELAEIFYNEENVKLSVKTTMERVLAKGAHDNATIMALKCCLGRSIPR